MLIHGKTITGGAVGSVRSSGRIGQILLPIINPHNLHVDGFTCRIARENEAKLVTPADIRDFSVYGIVIDDHDRLIAPTDAVRLQPVLRLEFNPIGLRAYVGQKKVGVVQDYAIDSKSLFVEKFYVQPGLLDRWNVSQLVFGRAQVEEITRTKITFIDSSKVKSKTVEKIAKSRAQPSLSTSFTKE